MHVVHATQNLVKDALDVRQLKFDGWVVHQALQVVVQEVENQVQRPHHLVAFGLARPRMNDLPQSHDVFVFQHLQVLHLSNSRD